MARKLSLRKLTFAGPAGQQEFDYADMMVTILKSGGANRGLTLDEVIKALAAVEPIEEAATAGKDEAILTDDQWATLKQKLDTFSFAYAHKAIAEFGLHIRQAPEIGTGADDLQPARGTRPQLAS